MAMRARVKAAIDRVEMADFANVFTKYCGIEQVQYNFRKLETLHVDRIYLHYFLVVRTPVHCDTV